VQIQTAAGSASCRAMPPGGAHRRALVGWIRAGGDGRRTGTELEVLAGAFSWGFKSPSPHQFSSRSFISLRPSFFRVTLV